METELILARERLETGRLLLGICLGAQITARAMGTVGPAPKPKIGWAPVHLTEDRRVAVLRHLDGVPVLLRHAENCEVPGLPSLAESAACPVRASQPRETALALRFHAEAGADGIERWLVGHCHELGVNALRRDAADHGPRLTEAACAMFGEWLDNIGLKGGHA